MPKTRKKKNTVEHSIAKAFAHPMRVRILTALNDRVASPNLLSQELDESLNLVAYHVRVLEKYDCVELVDTKQRRGATEHFYKATRREFLSGGEWSHLPEALRPGLSGATLEAILEDVSEAVSAGTFDAVEDRHLSRTPMVVDEQGWDEVAAVLDQALERLREIQATASKRLAAGKEAALQTRVAMMHFRSPSEEG